MFAPRTREELVAARSVVWVVAVVEAWHSANRVVRVNRPWTRAWRILLASIWTVGLNGLRIPFGAF